jgi:hypothetical protein
MKFMQEKSYTDISSKDKPAWISIGLFIAFLALFFLVGAGKYLALLFPLCSLILGIFLYAKYPPLYVGFTLWLFFLAPEIRRLIDYQSGFLTFGTWNFVPFLVASISFITLAKNIPESRRLGTYPFVLCLGSVCYGFLIGLINNPITTNTKIFSYFFSWFSPLSFAFYLIINLASYPAYRKVTQKVFLWGTIVMGIYGIFQYLVAPEWDRFFLLNMNLISFGKPEPMGIRVWSTMEAPHTFATTIMAGLLLLLVNNNFLTIPATGFGYLAFFLTQARTVWLSWGIGLLAYIFGFGAFRKTRVIFTLMTITIVFISLTQIEPFSEVITSRFQTFSGLEDDASLQARTEGYNIILSKIISNFLGNGIGSSLSIFETDIGGNDSTILPMLNTFGWIGIIPYFSGIILLLYEYLKDIKGSSNTFSFVSFSISIGILGQIGLSYIFVESMGMMFWFFLGISIAGKRYESAQKYSIMHSHQSYTLEK